MLSLRTQNLIDVLDVLLMVTMISFCSFIQCTSNVHIIGSIYLVRTIDIIIGSLIQILVVRVYRLVAYAIAQEHLWSDLVPFLVQLQSV